MHRERDAHMKIMQERNIFQFFNIIFIIFINLLIIKYISYLLIEKFIILYIAALVMMLHEAGIFFFFAQTMI